MFASNWLILIMFSSALYYHAKAPDYFVLSFWTNVKCTVLYLLHAAVNARVQEHVLFNPSHIIQLNWPPFEFLFESQRFYEPETPVGQFQENVVK